MTNVYELDLEQLGLRLREWGQPGYRARQVYAGLWRRTVSYEEMTDLPKALRMRLAEELPEQLETMANYRPTRDAIARLLDPDGMSLGARHVTVSTVGVVPETGASAWITRRWPWPSACMPPTTARPGSFVPIARRLRAHVNLIPMNPISGSAFQPSTPERIQGFVRTLRANGVPVTLRDTRGREIEAACGQLRWEAAAAYCWAWGWSVG
ncbi:MAG TPA: hypothetical protein VGL18_06370 [Actinomycetota bacterium]